jgi:hypothetical protein
MFSTANLSLVAYAHVAADGTSNSINSGLVVTKIGTGVYNLLLPGKADAQEPLQLGQVTAPSPEDLVVVTPTFGEPMRFSVAASDTYNRQIYFANTAGAADSAFNVLIFRSQLSIPTKNGTQVGPL